MRSAAIVFYALLAFVPGLDALVSLYGLVADPADVQGAGDQLVGRRAQRRTQPGG